MSYHIEQNTIQETLIIPLFARKICSDHYPDLFYDAEAVRLCNSLDYDFSSREKLMNSQMGLFGALEVAQRQYDLQFEVEAYLKDHPEAAVVNMGCGLDDTFHKVNNHRCHGYNIDFPDVIEVRNELLETQENETNLAYDLNDTSWFDLIDDHDGAIFFASGVFYYFKTEDVKALFNAMAERFKHGVIVFDSCNKTGANMMRKTWLKEAGITDVKAYFSLEDPNSVGTWSDDFESVTNRSYMCGYRDIRSSVSLLHRIMIWFCDHIVKMAIVKVIFK
ncbi:MAG: class I SAM-dependent methyltransferase [Erysipelotrichaceae bacterium]|nr:class I SAM-dependent methyltransferase [Erysipelotrichaceae bacterium]